MHKLMVIEGCLKPKTLALGSVPDKITLGTKVIGNTAIIPIRGAIVQDFDFFGFLFGGVTSMDMISNEIQKVKADSSIDLTILDIGSPGGEAAGIDSLADEVRQLAEVKTVIAVTADIMASGAYWFASPSTKIFATSQNAMIGSVGARMEHIDSSEAFKMQGIKITEIAKGKFKGMGGPSGPLSKETLEHFEDQVSQVHGNFVNAVAENRGVAVKDLHTDIKESKLFLASEALEVGLIDGIDSLENIINIFEGGEKVKLTVEDLKRDNLGVYEEVIALGVSQGKTGMFTAEEMAAKIEAEKEVGVKAGIQAAVNVAVDAERVRIKEIRELAVKGQESLVDSLIAEGADVNVATSKILADLKTQKGAELELIKKEGVAPVSANAGTSGEGSEEITKETFAQNPALVKEFGHFEVYDAYVKSMKK